MRLQITWAALALFALPGSVLGGSIQPAFVPDDSVTVHRQGWLNGSTSFTVRYNDAASGRTRIRTGVGAIQFQNLSGTGEGDLIPLGSVATFCIDLRDPLIPARPPGANTPIAQFEVQPLDYAPNGRPLSQEKQTLLRRLFSSSIFGPIDPQANLSPPPGLTKRQATMAFSLAVWEIVYEKPGKEVNVTAGNGFRAMAYTKEKKKVAAKANEYLAAIQSPNAPEGLVWALIPFDSTGTSQFQDRYQDLIVGAVPEPGTVVLLTGLGAMVGLALVRRRWRRASAR